MSSVGGVILGALIIPVVIVVVAGLIVLVAATVSGGRRDDDPAGERATTVFLGVTSWVGLFTLLFATFAVVVAVVGYIHDGGRADALQNLVQSQSGAPQSPLTGRITVSGDGSSSVLQALPPGGTTVTSTALAASMVALAAGGVLALYWRRLWDLVVDADRRRGPAGPPVRVYLLAAVFASVFLTFGAGASFLYGIYRAIAPGVAGVSGHAPGLRQMIDSAYLALGSLAILRIHHRRAFPAATQEAPTR